MISKIVDFIFSKVPLPNILKRGLTYAYLQFYYGDMVRYETLIEICEKENIMHLPGDILEIGAFVGGGTRKLASYARKFNKRVYTLIFLILWQI